MAFVTELAIGPFSIPLRVNKGEVVLRRGQEDGRHYVQGLREQGGYVYGIRVFEDGRPQSSDGYVLGSEFAVNGGFRRFPFSPIRTTWRAEYQPQAVAVRSRG